MKDLPVRNIFLPAALVASSVFSALTLPVALEPSTSHVVNALPILGQSNQMDLDNVHKDIAIPYIGTVIVLSAGAGILTAELVRKRYGARQKAAEQAALIGDEGNKTAAGTDPGPVLISLPLANPAFEWPTPASSEAESFSESSLLRDVFPETLTSDARPGPFSAEAPDQLNQGVDHKVVVFPGQYQRCRIQVPHLQEQNYAIEFDDQFYSLLTASVPKEQALAAIEQLAQEERAAILTRMNQGYAVWVLEPQAKLVSVA